jgi:hypothetical protein
MKVATGFMALYHSVATIYDESAMRIDCGELSGTPIDRRGGSAEVSAAYRHLMKDGYVILDRLIAPAQLAPLIAVLDDMPQGTPKSLAVASRRHVRALALDGAVANPCLYANPTVVALAREALDENAILLGLSADTVLPGGGPQHVDRDGRPLFDAAISTLLPAHAITCVLPLEGPAELAVWPGSHRWKAREEDVAPDLVELAPGACLVRDSRLFSSDPGNRSETRRIALRAVYARRWYRDSLQGLQRPTLRPVLGEDFLAGIAPQVSALFAHMRVP